MHNYHNFTREKWNESEFCVYKASKIVLLEIIYTSPVQYKDN